MALQLVHDVTGAGRAVVLLHSGVCDRRMWEPQWRPLAERIFAVRCDLRGFGETPLPPERSSYAADVVALLDHLDIARASLVGSSLGGRIALEVAATRPERVDKLALLCGALGGVPRTAALDRFVAEEDALLARSDVEGAVELNVRTWLGPDASEETRALVRDMQRHAFEVQLASSEVDPEVAARPLPDTSIRPGRLGRPRPRPLRRDRPLPDEELGRARHVELDSAGHLPSLERPDEVTQLLLEFLD